MNILITNDDGIMGDGLRALVTWARTVGNVTVMAPKTEQSACSQSIRIRDSLEVRESDRFSDLGVPAYTVASTPADCVRIGLSLHPETDIVFSGMNNGFNTGVFIDYSGTCAACFEAHAEGKPAVAFSTDHGTIAEAAKHFEEVWAFFEAHELLKRHDLYNVNIPADMRGIRITRQELTYNPDDFLPGEDGTYIAALNLKEKDVSEYDVRYDMSAFFAGFCSITPLQTDRTAPAVYQALADALNP